MEEELLSKSLDRMDIGSGGRNSRKKALLKNKRSPYIKLRPSAFLQRSLNIRDYKISRYNHLYDIDTLRDEIRYRVQNSNGYERFLTNKKLNKFQTQLNKKLMLRVHMSELNDEGPLTFKTKPTDDIDLEIHYTPKPLVHVCAQVKLLEESVVKKSKSVPDLKECLKEIEILELGGGGSSSSGTESSSVPSSRVHDTQTSKYNEVNIDELSSYFDTMVYIPKKMSEMAEMMYT